MKIRVRLIVVIIPILLILHLSTSIISGIFSTRVIEKQARESAQLLSYSFATQLNSRLIQYLNISQDLSSSMITAIHIETTLKTIRKRYPQITNIFYAPAGGDVLEMAPYQPELIGYPISAFEAYQTALKTKTPTMSKAGTYFGKKSVIFFAPAILSFVSNQEPIVQGIVALVIPLEDIFWEINHLSDNSSGAIFVIDNQGNFLFHDKSELTLTKNKQAMSSHPIMNNTYAAMIGQQAGFVTYTDDNIENYIAFSPIVEGHWSLGVYGTYNQITSAIDQISHVNIVVTLIVIFFGAILLYFVVRSVVRPIEQLTTFAQQIAHGDRTVTSDIQTSSEVGILSTSINSMVQELRGHHDKLEKTVEERTIALQNSNTELNKTVEELDEANTALQHTHDNLEILVEERTEQLQKALNYIDNIIDSMPSVLIGIDPNGAITQWNAEAEKNTKLPAKDVLGKSLVEVIPQLEDIMDKIFTAIQMREKFLEPKRTRRDNNKIVYESITVYPLISNGIDGAVIRIDNITERVRIEESLHQSQKLDAIGQLAGGVAHDFNNMLSGILGAAQLLNMPERKLDEKSLKLTELIIKSVTRAADLTAKLLAFGRKSEILFSPIDIHSIIDDARAILSKTFDKKIQLNVEKQAGNSTVIGDSSALQSALMNIGINASHAMPSGGKIVFNTRNITLDPSYCKACPFDILPGDFIDIEISDTGQGIPQDQLRKIFEPFFTTKEKNKGTGLGLAAVYGTIQDHHGAINVYSEKNTGTVFHIYLPCSKQAVITDPKNEVIIPGSGTILLVDDEEIIRITGKNLLNNMGYDVLTAENGKEGLEIFREQHAQIDAVIMDMIMPIMDGHEAFLKMKEIDNRCKIIISSGFSKNESLVELREAGLAGFIRKPFRDFELSNLLAKILNSTKHHS